MKKKNPWAGTPAEDVYEDVSNPTPVEPPKSGASSGSGGSSGGNRSKNSGSSGSSKGKSSKTFSGHEKQGGNGEKMGSSNGLTPPPDRNPVLSVFEEVSTPDSAKNIAKQTETENNDVNYVSGSAIKAKTVFDTWGKVRESAKDIDPNAQYKLESGEIVTGKKLQYLIAKEGLQIIQKNIRGISPGVYIEKDDTYYKTSPEIRFLISHSDQDTRQDIIGHIGSKTPEGFVGPVYDPYSAAYKKLDSQEKAEYNLRFMDWTKVKPSEIQYYPGGQQYLQTLSEKEKTQLINRYLEEHPHGVSASKYASIGGIYSGKKPTDPSLRKEGAWEEIALSDIEQREKYWSNLPTPARWYSSLFQGTTRTFTGGLSIPHYVTKVTTGKGLGPDFTNIPHTYDMGKGVRGPGLIRTGIGETVGAVTGESPDLWERVKQRPIESLFATGGEIFGSYLFGKGMHTAKVGTIRGLGRFRSSFQSMTGVNLPGYSQISYYYPQRMIRRAWVKLGTRNIDDVMGTPYHNPQTLTKGGLSFAPGKYPTQRINWTIDQLIKSKGLGTSDDFLLGSASSQRIGRRFVIQSKKLHELPGMSATPYGSTPTRFYRFGASNLSYSSSTSLFPRFKLPSSFAIRLKKVYNPMSGSYDDISQWAASQPKGSWGMIGPKMLKGGPETEINIFGKTILKRFLPDKQGASLLQRLKGYQYYTKVPLSSGKFEVTPVVFTSPVHQGFPTGLSAIGSRLRNIGATRLSSSPASNTSSIFNISSVASGLSSSIQGSSINNLSSFPSYPSSIPTSFQPYQPSKYWKKSSYSPTVSSNVSIGSSKSNVNPFSSIPLRITKNKIIPYPKSKTKQYSYSGYSPSTPYSFNYDPFSSKRFYGSSRKRKKNKKIDWTSNDFFSGYRERKWKVPTMKDMFKGVF